MTTISIPPDLEQRLLAEARRRGTTPELLAVDTLRQLFSSKPAENGGDVSRSLHDFLGDYVGAVAGSKEPISENTGFRFANGLVESQRNQPGEGQSRLRMPAHLLRW